jgi:hypothetical protein
MDNIPHLALPLRLNASPSAPAYVANQQDMNDEVAACVAAIVSYERGTRDEDVDFGIRDPAFQTRPLDVADMQSNIERYESRAVITVTENPYDARDPLGGSVTVGVSVLLTEDV